MCKLCWFISTFLAITQLLHSLPDNRNESNTISEVITKSLSCKSHTSDCIWLSHISVCAKLNLSIKYPPKIFIIDVKLQNYIYTGDCWPSIPSCVMAMSTVELQLEVFLFLLTDNTDWSKCMQNAFTYTHIFAC